MIFTHLFFELLQKIFDKLVDDNSTVLSNLRILLAARKPFALYCRGIKHFRAVKKHESILTTIFTLDYFSYIPQLF